MLCNVVHMFDSKLELEELLESISPDIMVVGSDWKGKEVVGSFMQGKFGFSIDSEITQPQKQFKVLLIGDSCTDVYVYGTVNPINPEAPVPVLDYIRTETRKLQVAWNSRKSTFFGIDVTMITNGENIVKTRYIDEKSNQQILRVDIENDVKPFKGNMPEGDFDALVISDYDKGFITSQRLFELVEWFDGPIFIDSKKNNSTCR